MVLLRNALFFMCGALMLALPAAVFAQVDPSIAPFTLSVNPTYPTPYGQATVSVQSTSLDLSASTMVASVNGTQVYQGDVRPFSITIGAPGAATTVKVTVTNGGTNYSESLSVTPGDVALVLEPQSSAPALYKGEPLIPMAGSVRAVAVPNFHTAAGTPIDPNTLSYVWTVDGTTFQNSSGIGRSSVLVAVPAIQYRQSTVSVVVKTTNGAEVGSASADITGNQPIVRMYQSDPLLGVLFDHALGSTFSISGSEISFFGVPFSFSSSGGGPALSWSVGGSQAQTGSSLTLRPQGSGAGSAALSFTATNANTNEMATANSTLSFGSGGSTIFGL